MLVKDDEDILKKVHLHSVVTTFAIIVLPVSGGPIKNKPLGGESNPENKSGHKIEIIIISFKIWFSSFNPTASSNLTSGLISTISAKILSLKSFATIDLSSFLLLLALLFPILFVLLFALYL